jgi:hypothetical protein
VFVRIAPVIEEYADEKAVGLPVGDVEGEVAAHGSEAAGLHDVGENVRADLRRPLAQHTQAEGRAPTREESFALVGFRNAANRVLCAEHRMTALNAETYSLGRLWGAGWIERSRVVRGMETVSRHNGLVAKRGLEVVRAVILGALTKGAARPYPDLTSRR